MPPLIAETPSMSRPLSLLYTHSKLSVLVDFYHISNWNNKLHILIKKSVNKPNFVHLKLSNWLLFLLYLKCLYRLYMCTFSFS